MNRSRVSKFSLVILLSFAMDAFAADACSGSVADPQTKLFESAGKGPLNRGFWQTKSDGVVYHYVEINGKWMAQIDSVPKSAIDKATGKKKIALQGFAMGIYLRNPVKLPIRLCADNGGLEIDVVGSGRAKVQVMENGFRLSGAQGTEDVVRIDSVPTVAKEN